MSKSGSRSDGLVATVETLTLDPGSINVVPGEAMLTIDMRCPDERQLKALDIEVAALLVALTDDGSRISFEVIAQSAAVTFRSVS